MFTVTERTSCAGCDVRVGKADQKKMQIKFMQLDGEVGDITDKSVDLNFPTQAAADEFRAFGEALGAIFD